MNSRQQFSLELQSLTDGELSKMHKRVTDEWQDADSKGHVVLCAVLYFDVQQIASEIENRTATPANL